MLLAIHIKCIECIEYTDGGNISKGGINKGIKGGDSTSALSFESSKRMGYSNAPA